MSRALSPHVSVLRGLPAACAGLGLPSKGGDKGEEPGPAGQSLGLTAVNPEARESEGQGSLECCSPWGHKEPDTTEGLNNNKKMF